MPLDRRIIPAGPSDQASDQVSFLVGQDGDGHWLAVEIHGLGGGIFCSREKALRYALDESHRQPGAVRFADRPMCLFAS